MPRVLADVAAGGAFGPAQWLALLGAALLSVCVAVFLCGSSRAKRGGGKASAAAQEMADRSAAAASNTRTIYGDAPTPEIAYRDAATASTATSGGGDPERSRRRCGCAGWQECGACGGPCDFGGVGGDFCCCCGSCDCGGVDCGGGCDYIGICCGACLLLLPPC